LNPDPNIFTNQDGSTITTASFNNLNQLTNQNGGGKMHFRGTVDEPSTVTVAGNGASVDGLGNFDGVADVVTGNNTVPIVATDSNNNVKTNNYQVTVSSGVNRTLSYDLDGNLINDGIRTYEWDAANRLLAINYIGTSNRTEFTYDGLSRRVKIIEKTGTTVNNAKTFVWDGLGIAEERNNSNKVTRKHYPQGVQFLSYNPTTAVPYFYFRDHLGSVREMTDGTGAIKARDDYVPWGNRAMLGGGLDADLGFTGHYYHAASRLYLAPYRAYDSPSGRWISRDPIVERGGIDLYAYVRSNPVSATDPLGLEVTAYYSIRAGWLTAVDVGQRLSVTGPASSGTNVRRDIARSGLGPIPRGTYDIFERRPGRLARNIYLIRQTPIPSTMPGRWHRAWRFPNTSRGLKHVQEWIQWLHRLAQSVSQQFKRLLQDTEPGPVGTIVSGNGNGPPNVWTGPRLGSLIVTP
jgi:RHS repeat-associated protein